MAQMEKPKHCPHCTDRPVLWLGVKSFWRINQSHLSSEILDHAPQLYSLEGISNYFSKNNPMHFLDLLLKSDHNAYKSDEKSL